MPIRIFLVEDHAVLRQALASVFDREPDLDLCGTAGSAEDALEALEMATCDVLVTDVGLPGMDGCALVQRVLADRPDLPVVVISARDEPAVAFRARDAGARAFLSKAWLARTLPGAVREVLRGGARFDVKGILPESTPRPPIG